MVLNPLCVPAVRRGLTKTLRIMKITAIILLSACLVASANGKSQSITLSVKNAPLEKVLQEIKSQTGFQFIYTVDVIQKAKPIDLTVKNANIEEVLAL